MAFTDIATSTPGCVSAAIYLQVVDVTDAGWQDLGFTVRPVMLGAT